MNCHRCHSSCQQPSSPRRALNFPWFNFFRRSSHDSTRAIAKIALVGTPNVGKSALFNALTGVYVTVSNYPGTTVEVSTGQMKLGQDWVTVIDTPGLYSLLPITEEEGVARELLLNTPLDIVIHVIDAKNLGRMLPLTFQLLEAQLPVIVALNMMDEARHLGLALDQNTLEAKLGIPVVAMSAAQGIGIRELKQKVALYVRPDYLPPTHRNGDRPDRVIACP